MGSSTLRLKKIMDKPETLDMSREWLALDNSKMPSILVYSEKLALAVLKSRKVLPFNPLIFWKKISKMGPSDLSTMDKYFNSTPLVLHQEPHRTARKQLVAPYRRIEKALDAWLPSFTHQFFSSLSDGEAQNPLTVSNSYLNQVVKEIFARDIGCPADAIPSLLADTFFLLPRAESLKKFDEELQNLVEAIEKMLAAHGGDPEDMWGLTSVAVMGGEAMLGTLVFGLVHSPPNQLKWTGEALVHAAAPVNILMRQIEEDTSFEDLSVSKGQLVQICPFIAHQHPHNAKENTITPANRSLSFGAGVHLCPGRTIALKILDTFFHELYLNDHIHFDTAGIKLARDFLIKMKE
jgi:hypothetical protein